MLEYLGKKEKGFTLMELLIAVAIVVILAGVGIPIYLKFQQGAKHAEANTNLNGIKLAEESYKLANGAYFTCAPSPSATPTATTQVWADQGGFDTIGFSTSAPVLFVYEVRASAVGVEPAFEAGALGDTDADTNSVIYVITNTTSPTKEIATYTVGTAVSNAGTLASTAATD